MDGGPLRAVEHPSAWRREDLERDASWMLRLTAEQVAEVEDAVRGL